MDGGRFKLGRLSSLAPEDKLEDALSSADADKLKTAKDLESVAELLYCACKGDVQGIEGSLAKGVNVDAADFDGRTALHLAACEGQLKVVEFLISKGANVNPADRWGSTVCRRTLCLEFRDFFPFFRYVSTAIWSFVLKIHQIAVVSKIFWPYIQLVLLLLWSLWTTQQSTALGCCTLYVLLAKTLVWKCFQYCLYLNYIIEHCRHGQQWMLEHLNADWCPGPLCRG